MAIESRLAILMAERKYNIQAVINRTGLDRTSLSRLYHDKTKMVNLESLDKLCDLFDCEPGDLLKRTKKKDD
jgi:putative transcriptional regulator